MKLWVDERHHTNGYRTGCVNSAEGVIEYGALQLAGRAEPFRSAIRKALGARTEALEALAVETYARGLPTRDIKAAHARLRSDA
jgi:hypothetical protein